MATLIDQSYLQASVNLATDLLRYGATAQWRGVYYRGAKIGFTVSQVVPIENGYRLEEDGQLEMTLLGATTPARIQTDALVDTDFTLRSFEFSLDPGTGPITVTGRVEPTVPRIEGAPRWLLILSQTSGGVTRVDECAFSEPPLVAVNLGRRLAREGLVAGHQFEWSLFDPATLTNAPVMLLVGEREVVLVGTIRLLASGLTCSSLGSKPPHG
ncbi:MAG: hypothetical protein VYE68_07890 [Acidobacteriota bacterium]|nr:hypothetical protein [Acidobacteriota bacterium]